MKYLPKSFAHFIYWVVHLVIKSYILNKRFLSYIVNKIVLPGGRLLLISQVTYSEEKKLILVKSNLGFYSFQVTVRLIPV